MCRAGGLVEASLSSALHEEKKLFVTCTSGLLILEERSGLS